MKIYANTDISDVKSFFQKICGKDIWVKCSIDNYEGHPCIWVPGIWYIKVLDVYGDRSCRMHACREYSSGYISTVHMGESLYENFINITILEPLDMMSTTELKEDAENRLPD